MEKQERLDLSKRIKRYVGQLLCYLNRHNGRFIANSYWSPPGTDRASNTKSSIYQCKRPDCQQTYIKDIEQILSQQPKHPPRKRTSRQSTKEIQPRGL